MASYNWGYMNILAFLHPIQKRLRTSSWRHFGFQKWLLMTQVSMDPSCLESVWACWRQSTLGLPVLPAFSIHLVNPIPYLFVCPLLSALLLCLYQLSLLLLPPQLWFCTWYSRALRIMTFQLCMRCLNHLCSLFREEARRGSPSQSAAVLGICFSGHQVSEFKTPILLSSPWPGFHV